MGRVRTTRAIQALIEDNEFTENLLETYAKVGVRNRRLRTWIRECNEAIEILKGIQLRKARKRGG
jgi:hypothetical protein